MADGSVDQTSGTLNPTDEPAHYIWEVPEYPEVNRMDGVKRCYVTEIRITNFKSYNGEHVVPLTIPTRPMNTQSSSDDRGDEQAEEDRVPLTLTGVIGPNGSGKSNLLDAVCFCLCVGARRLRNDRLKSLLNTNAVTEANGDSSASVSLTVRIEKESGDAETGRNLCDTTFTRSITMKPVDDHARRDVGEEEGGHDDDDTLARGSVVGSVYRVNDEICTQTQYKTELLKHHLDADASFFLVLQGQIDRLLSKDDAMSITKAIEAASGSWRYRKDYDIVAKKKEHAEDAVARLIAKRRQINQELNALAAQVQEADRYKDRKAELEKKQRDKLTYSLYEIEKEADALLESSEGLLESYEEAKAAVQEAQRQQNAAGEERKAMAEEHDRLQMSLEKERRKREETEVTMAELRGKKKQLTASEVEVAGRIDTTRKSLRDLEDRLGDIDDRIVEVKAALEALTIRRGKVDDEIGGGVLTEEIVEECGQIEERAQGVAASIENSIDACKEQQVLLSQCIDEAKATITRLEETKALRQREVDDAGTGMDTLRERLHARELAVAEERRERVERREARRVVEERLEKARRERQAVADELSLMRAGHRESERAATLRANVDRLIKEGPLEGARDGTSLDGRGKGYLILGLVSDLVRPSHKKYSQAIRAAIGRQHLEAVVVGTRKDALACIRWLKEKKIPPMTFIPIEDIDLPGLLLSNEDIPSNSGLRRAEDCVKAVNRVPSHLERVGASQRGIVESIDKLHRWLLGRSVVADTLAQARSVLSRSGRRKSPVMSSGVKAVTLDGDTIARNGNMTNGQGTVRGNTGDLWDAQQIASLKAELTQKDGDIVRIEKQLEEFSDIKGDVGEAVDGDDDRPKDLQTEVLRLEIETSEKDRQIAEEEIARLEARIEEIRHSLTDLDTQREETTNRMRDLQQELSDKTKNFYEDINKRVFGEDAADSDQDVMALIRDRKELIDTIDREMGRLEQQKDMLEGKREGLIEDLDRWRSNLASQESSLKELRRGLEELLNEEKEVRTEHGARVQTDGETVEELEAALEEAIARRDEASNRFDVAVQQLKGSIDRCNEVRVVVTKEEHRLQQLRYHHMQLVRSILSQPREQQQQQHQHSILSTQAEEEDRLPFENASEVLPALKRILFERGCGDDEEDEGTQDILDEYDALELKVDQGIVGRILSEASSRRGVRAGGKEVMAVLEDEIERLQEIITHLKPNLRAYDRNEEMRRALTAVTRSLEAARLEATEIGQHFEAVKNARRNRFNECYAFVRERVMTYYRQLTSRVASHRRTADSGGGTPEDVPLTPGPHGRAAAPTGRGSGQNDAGGSVYLDAENVTEPYLGVVQFSAHPESDRFVDSQLLSGGEKTIAAAALLFSLFAWQRPALILLDEVDAALDKMNLSTLSHFILGHTSQCKDPDGILQVILVSLKESFYAKTQALVGVYKDPLKDDSHLLSLDLRPYNGDAASGEDSTDSHYSQQVTKRTAQHPRNDSSLDSTNHRRMGG